VILTGGGSLLRDIHKRLHWEMLVLIPAAFKPRVVTPAPAEREFANWIGGSVLGAFVLCVCGGGRGGGVRAVPSRALRCASRPLHSCLPPPHAVRPPSRCPPDPQRRWARSSKCGSRAPSTTRRGPLSWTASCRRIAAHRGPS
jgi:hypothetical protein